MPLPRGQHQHRVRSPHLICRTRGGLASPNEGAAACSQGETWGPVGTDPALISPVCQGSILAGNKTTWFSNPANKNERADFTVRMSTDNAQTWAKSKLVSPTAGCGCKIDLV